MVNYADNSLTIGSDGNLHQNDTGWDDLRFPFFGRRMDVTSGRLDYNYTELGIDFADNCLVRYQEQIGMIAQLQHSYKYESDIRPHLHWLQSSANVPNWLLSYRVYENGATPPSWTDAAYSSHAFAYSSGTILQITHFPTIDMTGINSVSAFIDFKMYRDTTNSSTLFGGADPLEGNALAKEFDIHFQIDTPCGSATELVK